MNGALLSHRRASVLQTPSPENPPAHARRRGGVCETDALQKTDATGYFRWARSVA